MAAYGIEFDSVAFIKLFHFLIQYVKNPFGAGDGGKQHVKLVGQLVQWPCKLTGILREDDDHPDSDVAFEREQSPEKRDDRETQKVQHVHHFRDEAADRQCPKS